MRRDLQAIAGAAGVMLLASACGGAASTSASSSTAAAPAASTAVSSAPTATLVIWADDTRAKPLQAVAAKFQAEKGVTVKVVQKDFGKIRDDLISQGPSGQGPDIIVGAHDWLGKLVQNGAVAPIELGDKAGLFQKVAIDAMSYDGKIYGLPYAVENVAWVRNTALAPNPAKNFADAIATGQALVKAGKAKFPLAIQVDAKNGDPYHLYPVQTSFGSFVFGTKADGSYDPSKLELDNAAGLAFAKQLAAWGKAKVISSSISFDIAKKAFLDGQVPYTITGPWNTTDFTKAGLKFVVEPIPSAGGQVSRPFVGVQGFFISNFSKNKLLANDFVVNYLGTPEVAKALYDTGGRPPAMISVFDQVKSDPVIAGFGQVGAEGQPLPAIPAMDAVWSEWGSAEVAIMQGKGDPVQIWKAMANRIRAKIAG